MILMTATFSHQTLKWIWS